MGIGVSIFLIAVGAILTFAVHVSTSGFSLHTIGWILMAVGAIGLLTSLVIWGPRRRSAATRSVTYDDGGYAPPAGGRRVTREDSYTDTI
ncbi:MAG: DUF6458 family protein [Frankiaceae bacterium]